MEERMIADTVFYSFMWTAYKAMLDQAVLRISVNIYHNRNKSRHIKAFIVLGEEFDIDVEELLYAIVYPKGESLYTKYPEDYKKGKALFETSNFRDFSGRHIVVRVTLILKKCIKTARFYRISLFG